MDHLQADIDSLESERGELKEKLKSISKKALIEGLAKSVGKYLPSYNYNLQICHVMTFK